MTGETLDFDTSLAELPKSEWVKAIDRLCDEDGFLEPLGKRHFAAFIEKSSTLLVSFETIQGIRALSEKAQPLGWEVMHEHGYSHLCIACDGDTWFRDPAVFGFFDRLVDDGFFDEFDQVLFYGAGPCGYAAAAFSVVSPGARVLAIQPQATLDPRITEWDDRFIDMRRTDFTQRYGYAPDMLDAAHCAHVIYDPAQQLDAMHAALFTRPTVAKLRMRNMGTALQTNLLQMELLTPLIAAAAEDRLDDALFAKLYRARRDYLPYLRCLLTATDQRGGADLVLALCRNVSGRLQAPRFARRLQQVQQDMQT
ncbi:MAG: phosphoadenosine phosphosulfate reductase [Sulfitobacter sp.]